MSNHRIKLIAALSAISLCMGGVASAQSSSGSSSGATSGSSTSSSIESPSSSSSTSPSRPSSDASQSQGTTSSESNSTSSYPSASSSTSGQANPSYSGSSQNAQSAQSSESAHTSQSSRMASSSAQMSSSNEELRIASDEDEDRTLGKFKGQKVTGTNGEDLGKINDFVVDTQSGKVSHAVVSTGGILGIGDKLRLVKHDSSQAAAADEGFTANLDKVSFEAMPVVQSSDLDAGRIPSGASQTEAAGSGEKAEMPSGSWALASKIDGKDIRSGTQEVGTVNDVVIDVEKGTAHALVEVRSEFAGSSGTYLVPLNKLEIGSPQAEVISTTLAQTDFTMTQGSSSAAVVSADTTPTTPSTSAGTASIFVDRSTPDTEPTGRIGADTSTSASTPASGRITDRDTTSSSTGTVASTGTTGSTSIDSTTGSTTTGSSTASSTDTSTTASATTPNSSANSSPSSVAGTGNTGSSGSSSSSDETLTPTGRTSAEQTQGQDSSLMTVTASIRSALDQDSMLAREDIRVSSSEGKIVLRGTVKEQSAKKRAEDLAKEAAAGKEIENEITVGNQ